MNAWDQRKACDSCGRRDQKLIDCKICSDRVCLSCDPIHQNWDHKKTKPKQIEYEKKPEVTDYEDDLPAHTDDY